MSDPLPPGATIGILGGGQLGRMLAVAASRLGLRSCIFEPAADCPAAQVANAHVRAAYSDEDSLRRFARAVDVVTLEFENIPVEALALLAQMRPVRPGPRALEVSQDRLTEKNFLSDLGLATAPFAAIDGPGDIAAALARVGLPAILKTRRFGYDGKGQVRISDAARAGAAMAEMAGQPCLLEGVVDFSREVSIVAARGLDGAVACFDPGENLHEGGILRRTSVPARLSAAERTDAALLAGRILNALDHVGVMGVELFVTDAGLVVNEIAPRVHNSGHWTQAACAVDQFEQHIRAVAGWPLGDGSRYADVVMDNLIGDDIERVPQIAREPGAALHLYGKAEVRPGRKMGHVNRVRPLSPG